MSDQTNLPQHSPSPNMPPEETQPHTPAIASRADTTSEGNPTTQVPAATEADVAHQSQKPAAGSASPHQEHPAVLADEQRPADPQAADDLMTRRLPGHEAADAAVLAASRTHTRRSFLVAGIATAGAYGFYRYLNISTHDEGMQPPILRNTFRFNAAVSRNVLDTHALSPTYPLSRAENLRINGIFGLKRDLVPQSWRLQLVGMQNDAQHPKYVQDVTAWNYQYKKEKSDEDQGHDSKTDPNKQTAEKMAPASMQAKAKTDENKTTDSKNGSQNDGGKDNNNVDKDDNDGKDENGTGRPARGMEEAGESDSTLNSNTPGLLLTLDDITRLKRYEFVTQFKCIEGWSQIVHWAGYRMADFLEAYPPAKIDGNEPKYVYMETPDGDYYVGYDMYVMRHPQTLLVTEMMGEPLTQNHGAPVRMHLPTKYGYKQIKRIGLISYTNDKPDDYWTKLGYDWFGGL